MSTNTININPSSIVVNTDSAIIFPNNVQVNGIMVGTASYALNGGIGYSAITQSVLLINTQTVYPIFSHSTASLSSAIYNYTVVSGSNGRVGNISSIFTNNSVNWGELDSTSIGTTTDITMSVGLNNGNVILYAASSSSMKWSISAIATYM